MIRLYDTMAREKREFVPIDPERITMYVCGPTVYGRAHIGNARPAVVFDTLARLIRHQYGADSLTYARNVTDVDDKIIASAQDEGVDAGVITARYEGHYLEDMRALGVRDPDLAPHATAEIPAMVAMIADLVAKGHGYAAEGHVLFSVASDPDYGALSRRDRDAMIAGARVEVAPYKRDPADFVLWKPSSDDVIGWDSPWGRGRPGWHIECSAMIAAHLGETIDIHGGGLDLIFPHHENEIAQSRCAHGKPLANYWVHNGFVDMGAEKMSKSLGNVITVDRLLAEGHRGETLRLALLSGHYRSPLPWTVSLIAQSKATLDRWYRAVSINDRFNAGSVGAMPPADEFISALSEDLNTPLAISVVASLFSKVFVSAHRPAWADWANPEDWTVEDQADYELLQQAIASARMLGLLQMTADQWNMGGGEFGALGSHITATASHTTESINLMVGQRTEAKKRRDFGEADRIRAELADEGVLLEDGPGGTTWRRA